MTETRLLLIGLDALDKDLVTRWVESGHMPNFQRISKDALQGDIENPRGLEAGSCWPTFYFGLLPAHTKQFDGARHFNPKTYSFASYRPVSTECDAIWTTLTKAGKLCGVIDAPYSYPVDDINGIKIIDRGAHVPSGGGDYMQFRTHPAELAAEIEREFGPDPAGGHSSDFFPMETADDVKRFVDIYVARINNKTDLAIHYWKKYKFDFFMPNFTEAHCAGHRCWHIHDSSHPDHDPELAAAVGDPVKDIYVAMDRAVGRLVEAAEQDARVLVYLSHGMGPGYSGTRLLDRILSRLESSEPRTLEGPLLSPVRKCWRQMPDFIRRSLYPLRNKISNDGFQPNRETRRFFEVFANDRTGGIRLNLIGREAKGTVHPEDFDAVCAELIEDLREVVNAETGEPIAEEILRVRDLYDGQFIDYLPDILITWNRSKPINAAKSPKIGVIDKTGLFFVRTGDHLPIGHFYALAKDIPPGIMNTSVRAEDFAPTIARIFDVQDIHTDGKAIARLLPSYELQANS